MLQLDDRTPIDTAAPYAPQEEALARCEYLLQSRRPFGLVCGPVGTGKSWLLQKLRERATDGPAVLIDLTGADAGLLLAEIGEALAVGASSGSLTSQTRKLRDRLEGLANCGERLVLLLDHLDETAADAIQTLAYLLRVTAVERSLTVVAAAREVSGELAELQRDFGWLQIELSLLASAETTRATQMLVDSSGAERHVLSAGSAAEFHRLSGGSPRQLQRLVELALLAREAEEAETVTPDLVQGVSRELVGVGTGRR